MNRKHFLRAAVVIAIGSYLPFKASLYDKSNDVNTVLENKVSRLIAQTRSLQLKYHE